MTEYYEDNIKKIICDYKENYKQIMESVNEYKECAKKIKEMREGNKQTYAWCKK